MKFKIKKDSLTHIAMNAIQKRRDHIHTHCLGFAASYGFSAYFESKDWNTLVGFGGFAISQSSKDKGESEYNRFRESEEYKKYKNVGYRRYTPRYNTNWGKGVRLDIETLPKLQKVEVMHILTKGVYGKSYNCFGFEKVNGIWLIDGDEKWNVTPVDDMVEITVSEYKALRVLKSENYLVHYISGRTGKKMTSSSHANDYVNAYSKFKSSHSESEVKSIFAIEKAKRLTSLIINR